MHQIYPQYADRVAFVAVGVDPTESAELLGKIAQERGYSWLIAAGRPAVLKDFKVISTSIKYAISRDGLITYQAGYGVGDQTTWQNVFEGLAKP